MQREIDLFYALKAVNPYVRFISGALLWEAGHKGHYYTPYDWTNWQKRNPFLLIHPSP
jgi:hypothetical protein